MKHHSFTLNKNGISYRVFSDGTRIFYVVPRQTNAVDNQEISQAVKELIV